MAVYGPFLRNCPDFHSCRFLLLLCEEVGDEQIILAMLLDLPGLKTYFFLPCCYSIMGGQLILRLPSGVV